VAKRLGWPFLQLSPTDFLRAGMDGIYRQVGEVFEDLLDLYGVVILFDEMDALVQRREGPKTGTPVQLDVTQKFLTTSMLPRLLRLRKDGRTIFFMATNHQAQFDVAIKRPGRFDLLIPMGPPTFEEKVRGLELGKWFLSKETPDQRALALKHFKKLAGGDEAKERLSRFTYPEMDAFLEALRRNNGDKNLADALKAMDRKVFEDQVKDWAKQRIALRDKGPGLKEFRRDEKEANIQ
jgi:ATP-dependent 26S proteasome regulatory subunit